MRWGSAVRILGKPGLKPYDTRRWKQQPHLTVSLMYLRDILKYLYRSHIRLYRMAAELAPYVSHPDFPEFHGQIEESEAELAHVGDLARGYDIRLTFHAPPHVVLSSDDDTRWCYSRDTLEALARILDAMGLGPESVIVLHVGGGYDAPEAAMDRFCRHVDELPSFVRARLALEHDDTTFDLSDVLAIHHRTGIPVVFDLLHHRLLNRRAIPLEDALHMALDTWPEGVTPKVHLASPSTAMRMVERRNPVTGKRFTTIHPPLPNQHSDFIHPYDAIALLEALGERDADVLVEARGHDLAVARVYQDILRFAPKLAPRLSWRPSRTLAEAMPTYTAWTGDMSDEESERVLVVVMNNERDFAIARDEGWYRIPVRRAPHQVAADYLAFYMTKSFGSERWTIPYLAPVLGYRLARRRDLLPEEPDHPRADEWYYKVELGPMRRLPRPIPSRRLRRVSFIPTTLERLLNAEEINDLWLHSDIQEQLHAAFKERYTPVEHHYVIAEGESPYRADMAIPCIDGGVGVRLSRSRRRKEEDLERGGWEMLYFSPDEVLDDLEETVEQVLDEVREHGGVRRETTEEMVF